MAATGRRSGKYRCTDTIKLSEIIEESYYLQKVLHLCGREQYPEFHKYEIRIAKYETNCI
jgi:hypothetical protein